MSVALHLEGHHYNPLRASGSGRPSGVLRLLALVLLLHGGTLLEAGEIRIAFPDRPGELEIIDTFMLGATEYIKAADLARAFAIGSYVNGDVDKNILYFRDSEVKITAFSVMPNQRIESGTQAAPGMACTATAKLPRI